MNMPGFTAESSLYKTSGQYRAARQVGQISSRAIYATAEMVGHEVIPIEGDAPWVPAPWGLPWGWGPGGWTGGGGGASPLADEPPGSGGGGGGGGHVPAGEHGPGVAFGCTVKELNDPRAQRCLAQQQQDAEAGVRFPHYVRCVGDNIACCRDYIGKDRKRHRVCKAVPKRNRI